MPRRTALIVEVVEAEPTVYELRLQHDWSAARGVPAHVTILFPFVDGPNVDEGALADLFARFPVFDFTLDRVEQFDDGTVWLHPEPSLPFVDLTAAVAQRWPDCPPYEGAFDEVIPHLTVSDTPIDVPFGGSIAARATDVSLFEEGPDGSWSRRRRFPLY
jgi:hypothetical protein